jgi:phytoene dehydrogenase-like protein
LPRSEIDAVVIGASLDGLVAAATLVRARARVVVVERGERAGGAAAPVPIPGAPGVVASAAMPMVGAMRRRIFDGLRLERHGVELFLPDPLAWTPLADGRALAIRADPGRASAELRAFSARDGAVWARFALWRRSLATRLEPLLGASPVRLERAVARFSADPAAARDVFFGSIEEIALRHFETPALAASLAQFATSGTTLGPRDPGSFFHLLLRMGGDLFGAEGAWGHVIGGTGRLAHALERAAAESGAEIRLRAPVRAIELHRGRAKGVVLADGTALRARVVLSSLPERTTLLGLLADGALPVRTRAAIEARRTEGTTVRIALALSALPTLAVARPAPGEAALAGVLRSARTLDELEAAHADARAGRASQRPIVELTIPSAVDPTLTPPGLHLALLTAHHAPPGTDLEAFSSRALAVLEEIAPGLLRLVVGRVVLPPVHPSQGDAVPGRMFADRPATTPVPGLILCGAAGHPGLPGSGLCGRIAARAAIRVLRGRGT